MSSKSRFMSLKDERPELIMPTFKHILFPVDFSERCRAVRPFAQSMAVRYNAKLTLLHVVQISTDMYGVSAIYPPAFDLSAMSADAAEDLKTFLDPHEPKVPIHRIVELGDPAAYITAYADANGVDLIMMPTHGYGKFRGLLLGSVTAKVLHDAKCAVWTSTHTEDPNLLAQSAVQEYSLCRRSVGGQCGDDSLFGGAGARVQRQAAIGSCRSRTSIGSRDGF